MGAGLHIQPAICSLPSVAAAAWELVAGEEAWRGHHPMQIILQVTQQVGRWSGGARDGWAGQLLRWDHGS